jgi:solute:Na+ symporter, SSS family
MILQPIDLFIIGAYFLVSISIGIYMSRFAGRSTGDFFLGNRKLPWYIAGTSMVATTFAADTPLAVTELVATHGIAGNWLWWNMLFGGMMTVFFFAKLWRRANILTDAEFVSIRYSGKPADFLRGFRAIYIGVFMNVIVMAWVNLAMVKILTVLFPDFTLFGYAQFNFLGIQFSSHLLAVALLMVFVAFYSSLSGLWGVSLTDTFQFIMAMSGSIALAIFALKKIGGTAELQEQLSNMPWVFRFFPSQSGEEIVSGSGVLKMGVTAMVAYLGVQWWSSWYPGAEPGGGGYVAQRIMSAKNEKHSVLATLWFQVAHYALRPWPWIIVALVALVLYPGEPDKGATYVMMIRDLLPPGLMGLLLAAFFAAYMSTMASQTVWGTSYIINDLYKPYLKPGASDKFYVKISRMTTYFLMALSLVATTQFVRISDAWKLILVLSAGIGLVLLLRWFWWRINAWSEISAMLAPYAIFPFLKYVLGWDIITTHFEISLIVIVAWSSLVWITVTFLTKPSDEEKLNSFYRRVHPGGIGWKRFIINNPDIKADSGYGRLFLNWALGCAMVLLTIMGFGRIIFRDYVTGILLLSGAIAFFLIINISLKSMKEN